MSEITLKINGYDNDKLNNKILFTPNNSKSGKSP